MQQALIALALAFYGSIIGKALIAAAVWLVLDAVATAGSELIQGRFASEAFSYFLEKIGGEYVGLVVLGLLAYLPITTTVNGVKVNPLVGLFLIGIAAFTQTEMAGALAKIQDFVDFVRSKQSKPTPQAPSAP